MQTTTPAINNSATPPALLQYIPDHLLDKSKRDYYETTRTLVELQVRGVELGIETHPIETHPIEKTRAPVIRVQAEYAQHMTASEARDLAIALLQLANVQEELALQVSAA